MTITYTLPDFTQSLGLNLFFVRLLRERPELCRPGVEIDSIYGCFPSCALNGGRALVQKRYTPERIEQTYRLLDEYGLTARLTLTNMMAGKEQLEDPYTRQILELGARHGAEAIVYSDEVAEHVRKRYGMATVLSTTRAITSVEEFNRACHSHKLAVLDYSVHKDRTFLGGLKHPDKAEVMVNEFCVPGCPHRHAHYLHISSDQARDQLTSFECLANKADFFNHRTGHPVIFTADEVRALSRDYGIRHFKIVGRGVPFATQLEALSYYLVRPERQLEVKKTVETLARR